MPFVIHHVGARFGNAPFPLPQQFASEFELILFDADDDCVEGLIERDRSQCVRRRFVSACLSDRDGEAQLKITTNPSASSLLEPSSALQGLSEHLFGIDWYTEDCFSVVERRTVMTSRLDTLLSARPDIPVPDFLSLDAQGSEPEIISGGIGTIEQGVVGIIVEVEFIELYAGVKRFGEISDLIQRLGFHFCGFLSLYDAYVSRQPIGFRSKGFPAYADALFLRRIDEIPEGRPNMATKLALASLIFGFLDYAIAAIAQAGEHAFTASPEIWMRMLGELHEASRSQPQICSPRFPDILRPEFRKRFSQEPDIANWPSMMDLASWLTTQEESAGSLDRALAVLLSSDDSPMEGVLRKYGLSNLADVVANRRRDEAFKLRDLIIASVTASRKGAERR